MIVMSSREYGKLSRIEFVIQGKIEFFQYEIFILNFRWRMVTFERIKKYVDDIAMLVVFVFE